MSVNITDAHVLIIDDEPFMRNFIKRLLVKVGISQISEASDGSDGLTKLGENPPDLVILDIMMEPMNGLQFLKSVRIGLSKAPHDLPVIVLTGSTDEAVASVAMALDCDGFVQKSVGSGHLEGRILRIYSEKAAVQPTSAYFDVRLPEVLSEIKPPKASVVVEDIALKAYEVPLIEVEAGAIIEHDVSTEEGHLLVAAGCALTQSQLDRLLDLSEIIELDSVWVRQV